MLNTNHIICELDSFICDISTLPESKQFIEIAERVRLKVLWIFSDAGIRNKWSLDKLCKAIDDELFIWTWIEVNKSNYEIFKKIVLTREIVSQSISEWFIDKSEKEAKRQLIISAIKEAVKNSKTIKESLESMTNLMASEYKYLDSYVISFAMSMMDEILRSKKNASLCCEEIGSFIITISSLLNDMDTSECMTWNNIAKILSSLEHLTEVDSSFFEILTNKVESCSVSYSAYDIMRGIAWLSWLESDTKNILEALASKYDKISTCKNRQILKNSLASLWTLERVPNSMLAIIFESFSTNNNTFSYEEISAMLNWIYSLAFNNPNNNHVVRLVYLLLSKIDNTSIKQHDDVAILRIYKALSLYKNTLIPNLHISPEIQDAYSKILEKKRWDISNEHEKLVDDIFKKLDPSLRYRCNEIIDWIEMDFFFPENKINLEIDWSYHLEKKSNDRNRDEYLKNVHDIETVRIRASDYSRQIEDLREFIDKYL